MGFLAQTSTQLRQLWARLSRTQQVALIGIGVGALVFAFMFMRMGGSQTYVTAFTSLDPKDASAVTDQLKADKIPYQVTPDGTTVKVPSANLADARMKLAAKGLPQGGQVGFELFDKTSFGVTDFVEHLNYQRALEGELARTIDSMDQVQGSRVHIVVPQQQLFASQQKPATASVMLQLRPGRTLDESTLKGVSHLVARSVEGLDEKDITIVDSSGKLLFDGGSTDAGAGLTATQLDVEKKQEQGVQAQVQAMLDKVVGPSKSAVSVKADMDFSQQETNTETYAPGGPNDQGVVRSTQSAQENFTGTGAAAAQPGVAPNDPNVRSAAAGATGGNSTYQRQDNTTNYEVNKTTQKTVESPGRVKRLSVSVMLDSSVSQQDAAGLQNAIAAAAGIDQKRGDQIVVTTAAFNGAKPDQVLALPKPGMLDMLMKYGRLVVPLLAALLVLFFIWRMSRGVKTKLLPASVMVQTPALAAAGAAEAAYAFTAAQANAPLDEVARTQRLAAPALTPQNAELVRRRKEIQDRMTDLATANPDAMAEIIHSWMSQDNRKR